VIYFSSWAEGRPGALGGADLWKARILNLPKTPDYNRDQKVGLADFCTLARYWMQDELSVDIAPRSFADGMVNFDDLVVFTEYWLKDFRLIAHWKLDEAEGKTAHDSAGDKDGVVSGPVWRPAGGRLNGALEFEMFHLVSVPFVLNPADGPFTVFAWVKGGAPQQVIISQTDGTGAGQTWLGADVSNGKLMTTLTDGAAFTQPMVSEFSITDGQWHHIAVVWNGSHRHLYADGVEVAKDADALDGLQGSDGGLYFGVGKTFDTSTFFSGLLDDVRIYNQALSAEEIEELAR
jgi:hypothetical protein